jgi:hypothetical protein
MVSGLARPNPVGIESKGAGRVATKITAFNQLAEGTRQDDPPDSPTPVSVLIPDNHHIVPIGEDREPKSQQQIPLAQLLLCDIEKLFQISKPHSSEVSFEEGIEGTVDMSGKVDRLAGLLKNRSHHPFAAPRLSGEPHYDYRLSILSIPHPFLQLTTIINELTGIVNIESKPAPTINNLELPVGNYVPPSFWPAQWPAQWSAN